MNRRRLASLAALSLLSGGIEAAFLVVVTRVGLAVAGGKSSTGLIGGIMVPVGKALALASAMLIVRLVASLATVSVSTSLSADTLSRIRSSLADAYLGAPWSVQQSEPRGRLQQLLTTVASGAVGAVQALSAMVSSMLNLVALMLVALVVNPAATAMVIAALAGLGALLAPVRLRIQLRSRSANRAAMEFATSVAELGSLSLEMQAFGVRREMGDQIDRLLRAETSARRHAALLSGALSPTYTSLAFGAILVGLVLAQRVDVGELSAVGAVMLVMLRSLGFGQQYQSASGSLAASLPPMEMVDEMIERCRRVPLPATQSLIPQVGAIEFRDVCFEYETGRRAISDVSFEVLPGEMVGVIGPSGSGKSTIIQLLLGIRSPLSGWTRIDGVDVASIDRRSLASVMAYVPQDAHLFSGSVADNVRFFRDTVSEEAVHEAFEAVGLDRDVRQLPDGILGAVGHAGSRLSGGQRQRIAIARALAGRPRVLVLDEPTSSLDVESERLIKDLLARLTGRVSIVVVAHRMTTLELCSRILVVESGRVTGFGRPQDLAATNDFYRRAVKLSEL